LGPGRHHGGADLGYYDTVRNKHGRNETNEKRTGESDHTPITYLLSTSLASCNMKIDSDVLFHTLYVIITNSHVSEIENVHRHSAQSFALILLQRSFVCGIVKKRALNQNKNTNTMLTEMLEIVLTPKSLGPPKIGGPRFKPF